MSYNTFPTFSGRGWSIKKRPITSTLIQQADSGAEYRTSRYQYPLYEFDIEIPYLTQSDYSNLIGFFNQQGGPFLPFYFTHDNDSSVMAQGFGTGDNTTTQFQLIKSNGSYWNEPIGGINGTPTIYANGVQILSTGTGTPSAPTLGQVAGGSKGARTYYVKISYYSEASHQPGAGLPGTCESLPSSEVSLAVSANNLLTIPSPPGGQGISGWGIYIGTSPGAETFVTNLFIGQNYTESTSALPAGGAPRATDGTLFSISASGNVSFVGTPAIGAALTWTGNYFYLVRFKDDHIETEQFMSGMYDATTITLRTFR